MPEFKVVSDFQPTGDQPQAIEQLVQGLQRDFRHQTLLGATGTGKTYSIAKVVEQVQRPTLVMVHNKTLAAQLYSEFREFFPLNAVEYFVSYYDYYQPEAYLPRTDTYIEKDADINEEIQKLRLAATEALLTRRDVIIVASVSAIYSLGSPDEYGREVVELHIGESRRRDIVHPEVLDAVSAACDPGRTVVFSSISEVDLRGTRAHGPGQGDPELRVVQAELGRICPLIEKLLDVHLG